MKAYILKNHGKPHVLKMEGFGIIDAIGNEVSKFQLGDKVIIGYQYGSYTEKIVILQGQALKPFEFQ